MSSNRFSQSFATPALLALLAALLFSSRLVDGAQISLSTDHDLTRPTYGMHGQFGSQVTYDPANGLNLKGTINDFLGPPIKIANGFGQMLTGSGMAGAGNSLKMDGAMLGIDAKMLEAVGGANLLKGGLLMGSAAGKTGLATAMKGFPGKKISSIIEVPVKVVAVKDLTVGKGFAEAGKVKGAEALATKAKGAAMVKEGEALKASGINQVMQGASEGLQNIGNMVQQASGNMATAFKVLPIVLDLPSGQQQQQHQEQQVEQQRAESSPHQYHQGNSLLGGLGNLLPGLNGAGGDPLGSLLGGGGSGGHNPFNLFGQTANHNGYAALLNNTHPLANILMNPNLNPFLLPLSGLAGGPLGQSLAGKQPASILGQQSGLGGLGSLGSALGGQQSSNSYTLFPGIRVSESASAQMPGLAINLPQKQPMQQQVQQVQQQQELVPATKA